MSAVVTLTPKHAGTRAPMDSAPAAPSPPAGTAPAHAPRAVADTAAEVIEEILSHADEREKFIPVTRAALMERLTRPQSWRGNQGKDARRFFRYLDYWRQANYSAHLIEMGQTTSDCQRRQRPAGHAPLHRR